MFAYAAELRDRTGLPDASRWSMIRTWDQSVWGDTITEGEYRQRMRNEMERSISAGASGGAKVTEMTAALPELRNVLSSGSLDPGDLAQVQELVLALDDLQSGKPHLGQLVDQLFQTKFKPIMAQLAFHRVPIVIPMVHTTPQKPLPARPSSTPQKPHREPVSAPPRPPPPPAVPTPTVQPTAAVAGPPGAPGAAGPRPPGRPSTPAEQMRSLFVFVKQDCRTLFQVMPPAQY
jgi:hypothetical protein